MDKLSQPQSSRKAQVWMDLRTALLSEKIQEWHQDTLERYGADHRSPESGEAGLRILTTRAWSIRTGYDTKVSIEADTTNV